MQHEVCKLCKIREISLKTKDARLEGHPCYTCGVWTDGCNFVPIDDAKDLIEDNEFDSSDHGPGEKCKLVVRTYDLKSD
ncbi:MAG: hypothetical protein ACTSQY_00825 [Candidatus Odinarchaeia archaeon]